MLATFARAGNTDADDDDGRNIVPFVGGRNVVELDVDGGINGAAAAVRAAALTGC